MPLQADWVRRKLDLPEVELLREMRVLLPDGRMLAGAVAHAFLWGHVWWLLPLWLLHKLPGGARLIGWVYRRIAENRHALSRWIACTNTCKLTNLPITPNPKRKENPI